MWLPKKPSRLMLLLVATVATIYLTIKLRRKKKVVKRKELVYNEDYYFNVEFMHSKGIRGQQISNAPASRIVTNFIDDSHTSLYMCFYCTNSWDFTNALIRAKDRGVRVILILDRGYGRGSSKIEKLIDKGVQLYINKKTGPKERPSLMHHKFMIRDEEHLLTGSLNPTVESFCGNFENVLTTNHPELVEEFIQLFFKLSHNFKKCKVRTTY